MSVFKEALQASAAREPKVLGHPDFEGLAVGERRTASIVAAFIDLTDFTGRSFWDDETEVVDLAHAVLSGFVETVVNFGGFPLGLRGDGLFAGFGPGNPQVDGVMALSACSFALDAVETVVNPRLERLGIARVQARAGLDYGRITFVRSGSGQHSEINPLGFAANFAAKCEKKANSWEVVAGEGLAELLPHADAFVEHEDSPKTYQRDYQRRTYRFYDYRWRSTLRHIPGTVQQLDGNPTESIALF
ncbi:adenylate/guanylate cyclase domain-containing protein [Arthrobacter sp. StoSoilA2]|uniref:adenylate/guanylate cyclase domain-containing protein n=1 Tax=Arthrobacter sp. StoSoilA2 TaxID=2830990 RepID=UPI001CC61C8B|nr:adenylate/guanylate cyclase domain-containing protein [Arthrobacter sp. StoSoilA2]